MSDKKNCGCGCLLKDNKKDQAKGPEKKEK